MKLSVVLAVQEGAHRLEAVVGALDADRPEGVEVLVVWASDDAPARRAAHALAPSERPWLVLLPASPGSLVPQLWRDGIDKAAAPRVALTIVHCVPQADWLRRILAADLTTWTGVGGPINQRPGSDALGWAIYLLRYTPYASAAGPHALEEVDEIAGDNALYDRTALENVRSSWADGFWEPTVHSALKERGGRLAMDPNLAVLHDNGYTAVGFFVQRIRHGYQFGRSRGLGMTSVIATAYAAASPSVPLLFGRKVLGRALGLREARPHLPGALPWLTVFIGAWALGEVLGAHSALWSRRESA